MRVIQVRGFPYEDSYDAFGAQNHTVIWAPNCTTTIYYDYDLPKYKYLSCVSHIIQTPDKVVVSHILRFATLCNSIII